MQKVHSYGYRENGVAQTVIEMMQAARDQGFQVTCDMHPYMAGMTFLSAFLPPWAFEGGTKETMRRLTEKRERQRILDELRAQYEPLDWDKFWSIGEPVLDDPSFKYSGKRISEIGRMTGKDPGEAFLDLLAEQGEDLFKIFILLWIYSTEDTLATFLWPYTAIGADGLSSSKESKVGALALHPRSWGTFAKVINDFTRGDTQYPLEGTIHKMTGLPALSLGIEDRGFIRKGMKADVVIFDLAKLKDKATYTEARQYAEGVEYAIVNGIVVIEKRKWTGRLPGRVLRKI